MKRLTLLLTLLTPVFVFCQIINIPDDYPTIQEGIDASINGDTVLVSDGTYLENISFKGKAITVCSEFILDGDTNHISNTIIDGSQPAHPDSGSVVMFVSGEDTTSILTGFSITGGTGTIHDLPMTGRSGGGITCYHSGAKICNNKIYLNQVTNSSIAGGGGLSAISFIDSKWVIIESNNIFDNIVSTSTTNSFGGGISCATSARIINNKINNNRCESSEESGTTYSGGLHIETVSAIDDVIVMNNQITSNELESFYCWGGGIYSYQSELTLNNNTISNNINIGTYCYGSAIYLDNISANNTLKNNLINQNTHQTSNVGAATIMVRNILDPHSKTVIINNTISNNSAGGSGTNTWGTAIWIGELENYEVIIDGNLIINNTGNAGSGLWVRNCYNYKVTNNKFIGNEVLQTGGAIFSRLYSNNREDIFKQPKKINNNTYTLNSVKTHPLFANNIFMENHSDDLGGAVYLSTTYDSLCPVFINNIFKDNTADDLDYDIHHSGLEELLITSNIINDNRIYGNWDGNGNIDDDPGFIDTLFRIDDSSPCFNTGIDSVLHDEKWYASPMHDFEGDPRPIYGAIDIGVDEYFNVSIPTPSMENDKNLIKTSPNPFSTSTTIEYELQSPQTVTITFYNQFGKQMDLIKERQNRGLNKVVWTPKNFTDGIYYFRLEAGEQVASGKVVLMR